MVNIYIEKYPFNVNDDNISPIERRVEIDNCDNDNVKKEKFYDWKLLECAIRHSLGLDIKNVNFKKCPNGKWECDNFEFSLSHSGDLVAVAISKKPIGIDIEEVNLERFKTIPKERILTKNELLNPNKLTNNLNLMWTVKESIFKKGGYDIYWANKIDSTTEKTKTKKIICDDTEYYLSIATDDISFAKYYLGEGVTLID